MPTGMALWKPPVTDLPEYNHDKPVSDDDPDASYPDVYKKFSGVQNPASVSPSAGLEKDVTARDGGCSSHSLHSYTLVMQFVSVSSIALLGR